MPSGSLRIAVSRAERAALVRLAKDYECGVSELAHVAVEEMIAAHRPPRIVRRASSDKPTPRAAPIEPGKVARTFQPKPCAACSRPFTPSGPRSTVCATCRAEFAANPAEPAQLETVWNGEAGRRGASLSSR